MRATKASGESGVPRASTDITPGFIAFNISSSKLSKPPVTPTNASTMPAVMPRNQWIWKSALRVVMMMVDVRMAHRRRSGLRPLAK